MARRPSLIRRAGATLGAVIALGAGLAAQPCGMARPAVNKAGFRPGLTVTWRVGPSPAGHDFPAELVPCVARAFEAWTAANAATGIDVRFVPGRGGVTVRLDDPGGRVLGAKQAGGWNAEVRDGGGGLVGANVWLTSNPRLLRTCDGVTKATLHEIGHLHGLADNPRRRAQSVMNNAGGPDDRRGRLPLTPTRCDAEQAASASRPDERRLAALRLPES